MLVNVRAKHLKDLHSLGTPKYDGVPDPMIVEGWLRTIKQKFDTLNISMEYQADFL